MNTDPTWLAQARTHIGLREIPGMATSPTIAGWLRQLRAWWRDDETPWCGTYIAAVMQASALPVPQHWYRAKGWLEWGVPLSNPEVGCVVVFERAGGGHVGLVVGRDLAGNLAVLGGNQGNEVSIASFPRSRVVGYRWPANSQPLYAALPLVGAERSRSEA